MKSTISPNAGEISGFAFKASRQITHILKLGKGSVEATDRPRIASLYAALARLVNSPVIELNRAVAVGMAEGPQAALEIVDRLAHEPALKKYHLLGSVRGDLLQKLGRHGEARAAFEAAAELAGNRREQDLLRRRANAAASAAMP